MGVVNNLCSSLLSHVEIFLGEKPVTLNPNKYHIKSILQAYSTANAPGAKERAECALFYLDSDASNPPDATNTGWQSRRAPFLRSQKVQISTRLRANATDIYDEMLIPDGLSLRVKLTFNPPEVYLWGTGAAVTHQLHILDATLSIPYYVINSDLIIAVERQLMSSPCMFRFKSTDVRTFIHPARTASLNIPIAFSGKIPRLLYFTLIESDHFNGKRNTNCFQFTHANMSQLSLFVNNVEKRIDMDMTSQYMCTTAFQSLLTALGCREGDACGHVYSLAGFRSGQFWGLCFDLTPDHSATENHGNLSRTGILRIQGQFATAPENTLMAVIYTESDACMFIDADRNVFLES